jgi:hypothetical protein
MTLTPMASLRFGDARQFGTGCDDIAKPLIAVIPFTPGLSRRVTDITHFPLSQVI